MAEDVRSFFRAVFFVAVSCQDESWGWWEPPKARFALAFLSFFSRLSGVGRVQPTSAGGEDGRGFFFGRGSLFFSVPARRRLGGRAAGAFFVVRLFFPLGFCVARGGPPSAAGRRSLTPPRRVFSASFFFFFPLAWQGRARVELAVKARSSSFGRRPFFSCQDEKLNAAETRASVAEARVLVLEQEKARPFFPKALRRVLLLKAAANFTCQLLMPTCRELLHLPTSHANLSRVTSPANFSCQLVESYFTC